MTEEELINIIHKEASVDVIGNYLKFLGDESGDDPRWNLFRKLYDDLSSSDRKLLVSFISFVQSDTISSVLSILDNQTYPSVQSKDLMLMHGEQKLNGDLLDIFLEKEEEGWD